MSDGDAPIWRDFTLWDRHADKISEPLDLVGKWLREELCDLESPLPEDILRLILELDRSAKGTPSRTASLQRRMH